MRKVTRGHWTLLFAVTAAGCAAAVTATALVLIPSSPARDPDTGAGARAAASAIMADYAARRFASAWQMLTPADQAAVPEATWVAVYDGCQHVPLTYSIGTPVLAAGGATAAVPVTAATVPVWVDFRYTGSRWRCQLGSLSMFAAGTVQADITADRQLGICT